MKKKLKLYRALVLVGRENLSDKGIALLLSLSRDSEIVTYYSRK